MRCGTPMRACALRAGIPPAAVEPVHGTRQGDDDAGDYTNLFDDDHAETMAALEAMSRPAAPNVSADGVPNKLSLRPSAF